MMHRSLFLAISLALCGSGCDPKTPTSKPVTTAVAAPSSGIVWDTARHPEIEFFIEEIGSHGRSLSTNRPGPPPKEKFGEAKFGIKLTASTHGPVGLDLQFLGIRNGKDVYKVKATLPLGKGGSSSVEKEIEYEGRELEISKDKAWRMGARPVTDDGAK